MTTHKDPRGPNTAMEDKFENARKRNTVKSKSNIIRSSNGDECVIFQEDPHNFIGDMR